LVSAPPSIGHFSVANLLIVFVGTTDKEGLVFIGVGNFHPPPIAFATFIKSNFVTCIVEPISVNQIVGVVFDRVIVEPSAKTFNEVPNQLCQKKIA
jgi:hypothetical protein